LEPVKEGQMQIVIENGRVVGACSWADGFKSIHRRRKFRRLNDDEALQHAEWIAATVSQEAALRFIDVWWEAGGVIEVH